MKKTRIFKLVFGIAIVLTFSMISVQQNQCYAKTYTIGPKTKPLNKYEKLSTYNKHTKQYYTVRSYLEKIEKQGGGTLVLKKGTYVISNALYVPDNTNIILKKGVVIKKGKKTGTKKFKPSGSIFSLCTTKKKDKKGAISKYNGVKNVKISGEGNPKIDLDYVEGANAIIIGHNQNVEISGIQFMNMNTGHFIELDASKNVTIRDCIFMNHKDSYSNGKEAINIDTPDKETKGFNVVWSAQDKTPNKKILITKNIFNNLERAVGTHKYSENKYHSDITITNNEIIGCDSDAIRVMNWKRFTIQDNHIRNVGKLGDGKRGILISGASSMTIIGNTFENLSRPMQFIAWKNTGAGGKYKITYNKLTKEEINELKQNTFINVDERFVRINKVYNDYKGNTDKIYF